jgi:16S rRNA (cytosine1402-N4)-methyltransferase
MTYSHVPVLLSEALEALQLKEGDRAIDATAGGGGHLARIAEAVGPSGGVLALDRDLRAHAEDAAGGVARQFKDRVAMVHAPFSEAEDHLKEIGWPGVHGLLADLGISSMHVDDPERGFSFQNDGPLDMRMDPTRGQSAAELIDRLNASDLADLIYHYGEERQSRRIARYIKNADPRPHTTTELARVVARAHRGKRPRRHPATRTFQALRIAVNRELDEVDALLEQLPRLLLPGGRAAIITFHSLEDRKVKHAFRDAASRTETRQAWARIVTRKPIVPSEEEVQRNPRARSARLRVIERLGPSDSPTEEARGHD